MLLSKRRIFFWISVFLLLGVTVFLYTYVHAEQGEISLEIQGIGIRHGTPENFNLGTLNTSTQDQEISGQFTDYFWIEDLLGKGTGHYTTIQCDGVYGPSGHILTGVYLKAGNTSPTLILGASGDVRIASLFTDYHSILMPTTYIYKPTSSANIGIANKYGDKPRLKVVIPGYTPPGNYHGTIVFSLYSY